MPITLAAWTDYLGLIIVVLMIVGSWISSALKEGAKKSGSSDAHRARAGEGTTADLDELAARRREQLQELARRRRSAAGDEPMNLTVVEADERARARAGYELRAAELRKAAEQSRRQREQTIEAQRRMEEVRRRTEQEARVRAQRARLRAQQEARQRSAQRAQAQAQSQAQAQPQATTPGAQRGRQKIGRIRLSGQRSISALGQSMRDVRAEVDHDVDHGQSVVHRHVSDADQPRYARRAVPMLLGRPLSRSRLRDGIILKEVLDKPIALR